MTGSFLPAKTRAELTAKHTDFVIARLSSGKGREHLEHALRQAWAAALRVPIREAVAPARLADGVAKALSEQALRSRVAPVVRDLARQLLAAAREMDVKLGELVPDDARAAIDRLLERPDAVPDRIVREVLQQEAVEHALRDVLFDGLKQFNDTVNPFFAEWGVPALLSWIPIGGSAVRAQLDKIRAEFDRRLDPEIRKFLLVFSRQATTQVADAFLARSNDPSVVAMRRHVVSFLYEQTVAQLAGGLDDEAVRQIEIAVESIVADTARSGRLRDELRRGLERFVAAEGDRSIGEWMHAIGASAEPDFEAWLELAWPGLVRAIRSPAFRELVETVNGEFYDSLGDPSAD